MKIKLNSTFKSIVSMTKRLSKARVIANVEEMVYAWFYALSHSSFYMEEMGESPYLDDYMFIEQAYKYVCRLGKYEMADYFDYEWFINFSKKYNLDEDIVKSCDQCYKDAKLKIPNHRIKLRWHSDYCQPLGKEQASCEKCGRFFEKVYGVGVHKRYCQGQHLIT